MMVFLGALVFLGPWGFAGKLVIVAVYVVTLHCVFVFGMIGFASIAFVVAVWVSESALWVVRIFFVSEDIRARDLRLKGMA